MDRLSQKSKTKSWRFGHRFFFSIKDFFDPPQAYHIPFPSACLRRGSPLLAETVVSGHNTRSAGELPPPNSKFKFNPKRHHLRTMTIPSSIPKTKNRVMARSRPVLVATLNSHEAQFRIRTVSFGSSQYLGS